MQQRTIYCEETTRGEFDFFMRELQRKQIHLKVK